MHIVIVIAYCLQLHTYSLIPLGISNIRRDFNHSKYNDREDHLALLLQQLVLTPEQFAR